MKIYGTYKRNKAERINQFIEGIYKAEGFYWGEIDQEKLDRTLTKTEQDFYRENSYERMKWSGSYDANNKKIDLVILGFKVIAEKLISVFPKYKEEYESDVLVYLAREERNSDLVGSKFTSYIGESTSVIKMDIPLDERDVEVSSKTKALLSNKKEIGYWYKHDTISISQSKLKAPFNQYEDGVYFIQTEEASDELFTPSASMVFSIDNGSFSTSVKNKDVFRFLFDESQRENIIRVYLNSKFDDGDYDMYFTKEEFLAEYKEEIEKEVSEKYPPYDGKEIDFLHFKKDMEQYKDYVMVTEEDEWDESIGYSCSNCKDGGCIYCSPKDYLDGVIMN